MLKRSKADNRIVKPAAHSPHGSVEPFHAQLRPTAALADWIAAWRPALSIVAEHIFLVLLGVLAVLATVAFTAHVNQFVFAWPVTGVLMARVLPQWRGPLVLRMSMLLASAAGVLVGGLIGGVPGWLALQLAALTVVDLCLMVVLLLPVVADFAALKQRRGVLRFALTSMLVPMVTACMGAPSLAPFLHHTVTRTGIEAFFSNSLGIALTFPLGLMLSTSGKGTLRRLLRGLPLSSLLFFALVASAVFWQNTGPFLFVVFPPMIMVLLLLGLEGAVLVSLLLSAIGWFATVHGHGPIFLIHNATPEYRLLILQIFIWTSLATAMPVGALLDERREAERKAEEANGISQMVLEHTEEMIILSALDKGRRYVSPAVERLTGWTPAEYLAMDRMDTFHPDDRETAVTILNSLSAGKWEHTMRYRIAQKQGGYRWVEATVRAYGNKAESVVKGYVGTIRDISQQRQQERAWAEERAALTMEQTRLNDLARTDVLTGLPNRRSFEEVLSHHEFDMRRQAERVLSHKGSYTVGMRKLTVMMVDVDFFKLYNDTYGHAEGDVCLRSIADALRSTLVRKDDIVARLGGEEFAIVLPGAGNKAAMRMAERMLAAVRSLTRPHSASPLGHVTVSIGVAVGLPATDFSYAHLLQQADRALYVCKGEGKNRASLNPGMVSI